MSATRQFRVKYFAALREQAGKEFEQLTSTACTPSELYAELSRQHGFTLDLSQVKVAVNSEYRAMTDRIGEGDEIVFIPPVAGG